MNSSKALSWASALLALSGTSAIADTFPEHAIEIVVPYAAGGATDVFARSLARAMSVALPNTPDVVVVNAPGGAGTIGLTQVANAEADGYTIVFTTSSPIALQPLYGRTPFTVEDFAPLAQVSVIPAAFNVHMDSDIRSVDDLVAWATANPGAFTYASTGGNGSGTHIVSEQFAAALGIQMRHIPFEGTAPLTAALMGGQVMGTMQMPDMHTGGEVRPIVFLTPMRPSDPVYADIPTSTELGIPAVANFFTAFLAPAGTPADRLEVLSTAIATALEDPGVQDLFENANYPISYAGPEAFGQILTETVASNRAELLRMGLISQ
ncbi:tripartite-type tricarboxylate transporter receptor subunit TctC [Aquamicrobium lusatiense]|uniref:Tripartite-type tricarboxylate transporter receptor subunit TctC n=1 Tax=Aquamicrobium lusatiense TaxID=89772 RepID=A0A7W9S747_9HYPH|nr:tripartite tricarboxylate transporter substrate binding protein [Aquamicrobium lusatiense]MBB6014549.1 tripartite-type tricarboxylate transporter receptor subunit TctC [Aquamicrobium lusatiense]